MKQKGLRDKALEVRGMQGEDWECRGRTGKAGGDMERHGEADGSRRQTSICQLEAKWFKLCTRPHLLNLGVERVCLL